MSRARMIQYTVLVAALLVPASAAGAKTAATAATPTIDAESVRSQVADLVNQSYQGLGKGNVACPQRIKRAPGVTFSCTVQLPGSFLVLAAQQVDGSGNLSITAEQAVLPRAQVEQFVAGQATLPATVDCATSAFLVARPGQKVTCSARLADGTTRQVEVLVRGVDGTITITSTT